MRRHRRLPAHRYAPPMELRGSRPGVRGSESGLDPGEQHDRAGPAELVAGVQLTAGNAAAGRLVRTLQRDPVSTPAPPLPSEEPVSRAEDDLGMAAAAPAQ